jgi:hypothetical protein
MDFNLKKKKSDDSLFCIPLEPVTLPASNLPAVPKLEPKTKPSQTLPEKSLPKLD